MTSSWSLQGLNQFEVYHKDHEKIKLMFILQETQEETEKCLKSKHEGEYGTDWASNNSKSGGSLVSFRRRRQAVVNRKLEKKSSKTHETNILFRGSCDEYFAIYGSALQALNKMSTNLTVGCSGNKHSAISCIYSYRLPGVQYI